MKKRRSLFLKLVSVVMSMQIALGDVAWAQGDHDAVEGQAAAVEIKSGTELKVIASNGLNVRQQQGARLIGAVPRGASVFSVGSPKNNWLQVQYKDDTGTWTQGFVYTKYVRVQSSGSSSQVPPTITQKNGQEDSNGEPINLKVRVNSLARFRLSPSTSGKIINKLRNNTEVEVIGKPSGDWIPVKVKETEQAGWVHATLLQSDSAVYGEKNPIELAAGHGISAELAKIGILDENGSRKTEGTVAELCESCVTLQNAVNLEQIPEQAIQQKGFRIPLLGRLRITSPFGKKRGHRRHKGVDFGVPVGTPVKTIGGGKVIRAGNMNGYGKMIEVQHPDGKISLYGHLSRINVNVGEVVSAGQIIAKSGNTGRSTGPHLHLEVFSRSGLNGNKHHINPMSVIGK